MPSSFGLCIENEDWSEAPCFSGRRGIDPSLNQMKQAWSTYYDFKGKEWMESKKQELLNVIQNGTLIEWKKMDDMGANSNVYTFYFLKGDVPNEDGLFVEEYFGLKFLSPLRQIESGIAFDEIHCGIELVLVQKYDGSPACVKPESIPKLIERGWAKDDSEKELAYQIHDVVAHVDLLSYSFDDEYGNMVVNVVEFLKNPKNASHLTIWGNFHEFEEYCSLHNCDHAIAYLYEDKNGIYHKGDFWEWIDSDKPTIVEKTIECYKMFHCESYGPNATSSCLDSKINGTTIKEICANADITIDDGCVSVSYQNNVKMLRCE